ncbi:glycoside hydrolase superfamily [Chytriomyces sp. MP71]|nr:glycoside hydrolase superfamily [Chytriomyces sp. MP71]
MSLLLVFAAVVQACTFGAYQCSDSVTLQQCVYSSGNTLVWSTQQNCGAGTVCSASSWVGCAPGTAPSASSASPTSAVQINSSTTSKPAVSSSPAAASSTKATTSATTGGTTGGNCYTPWQNQAYNGGATVSLNGINYSAKWWTNVQPTPQGGSDGSWAMVGPCGNGGGGSATSTSGSVASPTPTGSLPGCYANYAPSLFAGLVYKSGNKVSYNGQNWQATYQGAAGPPNSAAGSGWTLLGPCAGNGFTYKPFTTPGIIGYWTQWSPYSRSQNSIDKLDLTGFNAINYAFINVDASGTLQSFDTNADLNWLLTFASQNFKYSNLRTVASIGGWSGSRSFSTVAASASLTQTFVKNVHNFLDTLGMDGVDLDWEYPGGGGITCNAVDPNDAANFAKLLAALRAELGPNRSISIAVSAEVAHYATSDGVQHIPEYAKYVNYFQVMSYDFYGEWSPNSDFNSPLNSPGPNDPKQPAANNIGYSQSLSQAAAIDEWVKAGVPRSQLTNGLAFYGRSWNVHNVGSNNGLYQPSFSNTTGGTIGDYLDATQWCDPCKTCYNSGVWMYLNQRGAGSQSNAPLAGGPTTAGNGWTRQYFDFAASPTLFTPALSATYSNFISYDDPQSIQKKAAWAKAQGLGGTMIWELSQDYNAELVKAVRTGWGA